MLFRSKYIIDKNKLININHELKYIKQKCINLLNDPNIESLYKTLKEINIKLWYIEDKIRLKEKNKNFDEEFIDLARTIYITNDKRADIKKEINLISKSNFIEEKSYEPY